MPDRPTTRYQREPSSPNDSPVTLRKRLTHTERELAITRRFVHKLERELGRKPTQFFAMPRFGKLQFRPVLLGYAPSAGARSGLPFDDEFGDALCEVFGLIGYEHLLNNFKVRNVFLHPASDLPHRARDREAMDRALAIHSDDRLFDGRVVLVVGRDAQRAAGIDAPADYIGPAVAPRLERAGVVLTIPDIGHARQWSRAELETLWGCLAYAMAAARLPVADPFAAAAELQRGAVSPAWGSLYGPFAYPNPELLARAVDLWITLQAAGLAAPPNLTRGLWMPMSDSEFTCHVTGGQATLSGAPNDARMIVYAYQGERGKRVSDGQRLKQVFAAAGKRGDLRRQAEEFMFGKLGWEYPFAALDARLVELRR